MGRKRRNEVTDCYCDRNNIGVPGVSCGDCPERDYKGKSRTVVKLLAGLKERGEHAAASAINTLQLLNKDLLDENAELIYALEEILKHETKLYNDMATVVEAKQILAKAKGETG